MTNWHPDLAENLGDLLFKDAPIGIDSTVNIFPRGYLSRNFCPLLRISGWHIV
jgi:hypothetical protein